MRVSWVVKLLLPLNKHRGTTSISSGFLAGLFILILWSKFFLGFKIFKAVLFLCSFSFILVKDQRQMKIHIKLVFELLSNINNFIFLFLIVTSQVTAVINYMYFKEYRLPFITRIRARKIHQPHLVWFINVFWGQIPLMHAHPHKTQKSRKKK